MVELERLRRELAYRKQLSEQQNQMIAQQRAQLVVGREEISRIDSRVDELQVVFQICFSGIITLLTLT